MFGILYERILSNVTMIAEELLNLNRKYYKAFENFDLKEMENVWSNSDDVICIHPGWDILICMIGKC